MLLSSWEARAKTGLRESYLEQVRVHRQYIKVEYLLFLVESMFLAFFGLSEGGILWLRNPSATHAHCDEIHAFFVFSFVLTMNTSRKAANYFAFPAVSKVPLIHTSGFALTALRLVRYKARISYPLDTRNWLQIYLLKTSMSDTHAISFPIRGDDDEQKINLISSWTTPSTRNVWPGEALLRLSPVLPGFLG